VAGNYTNTTGNVTSTNGGTGNTASADFFVSSSPTATNGDVSGHIVDSSGNPVEGAAIRMNGTQNRLTITDAQGNYHFDNVETTGFYTVTPSRANYTFSPSQRSFSQVGQHTGVSFTPSEREALVNGLTFGTLSRAGVLQRIADDERFVSAKRNEAFVMMEYFGYLRRDPDESGYQFWLNKLNQFGGNFEQAEMVKAFIVSSEYRDRFR
jgi:hypothetical protein